MKNLKEKQNLKKGITLIALVVTIVVLLILASVSITVVFGDNGILQLAKEAGEKTNEAVKNDNQSIQNLSDYIKSLNWNNSIVSAVTSADGKIVPVPNGFVASEVDSENTVDGGFVIYEGTEPVTNDNASLAQTTRNQFVWVPVQNPDEIYGIDKDGNYLGKLYDFTNMKDNEPANLNWRETNKIMEWENIKGSGLVANREPDILIDQYWGDIGKSTVSEIGIETLKNIVGLEKDSTNNEILEAWKKQLQDEFKAMVESVIMYKGFYIGRYETGNLETTGDTIPVVQKQNNEIAVNSNWYYLYQSSKDIVKDNKSVVSGMIWGCQWDATMKWFLKSENEEIKRYVITDSQDKGNYSEETKPAGSDTKYAVNNIYDMAGNAGEWILEANDECNRSIRSGVSSLVKNRYASYRGAWISCKEDLFIGTRSILCINVK